MGSVRPAVLCGVVLLSAAVSAATLPSRAIVHDCPAELFAQQFSLRVLDPAEAAALGGKSFSGDTLKLLVIAVEWLEPPEKRPSTYAVDTLRQLFFSRDLMPHGSVADYFDEVSYGQLQVTGQVYGWFNNGSYVASGDSLLYLLAELDSLIDFTQYDGNGDGRVDGVVFVVAGRNRPDNNCLTDI